MGKWESMTFPRYADDVEGCEVETDEQTLQLSQLPAAVTAAQGQLGLRQGRGLHLGHHRIFPQEHIYNSIRNGENAVDIFKCFLGV